MVGINEKKNQHISMSMPNKDQLQTPTPSISNDDSRAPPHKNTVQVGATVDTSKKPAAALDDQERLQKFENEYDRQIRFPFPQIRVLSDTESRRMLKEVFEEDW